MTWPLPFDFIAWSLPPRPLWEDPSQALRIRVRSQGRVLRCFFRQEGDSGKPQNILPFSTLNRIFLELATKTLQEHHLARSHFEVDSFINFFKGQKSRGLMFMQLLKTQICCLSRGREGETNRAEKCNSWLHLSFMNVKSKISGLWCLSSKRLGTWYHLILKLESDIWTKICLCLEWPQLIFHWQDLQCSSYFLSRCRSPFLS